MKNELRILLTAAAFAAAGMATAETANITATTGHAAKHAAVSAR